MIEQFFTGTNPAIIWAILALIMAGAELLAPGIFLIWLAIAAGLTALTALLLPISAPFQMLAFAIFSALSVSGGRLWYLANPGESSDPLLNNRTARMIGRTVIVSVAIEQGEGRVQVDDSSWPASGPDCAVGTRLVITDAVGATLKVDYPAD